MYTAPTMHATFVVNCWVNVKPLNRTQPTNLQLCSNQSTNLPQFLVWGERTPKNIFARSPHICRSVPGLCPRTFKTSYMILTGMKFIEFQTSRLKT